MIAVPAFASGFLGQHEQYDGGYDAPDERAHARAIRYTDPCDCARQSVGARDQNQEDGKPEREESA